MFNFKFLITNKLKWQEWKLFFIGFIVAALFLPFNVIISANEGLLDNNFIIVNKYFYQLTVLISGFGASLAYLFKDKFKNYGKAFLIYLAIAPVLALLITSVFFNYLYGEVANPVLLIFILLQVLIICWFFLHGAVTAIFLQEIDSVKSGWIYHLLGLILGYLISFNLLNNWGIISNLIIVFIFTIQLIKFNKSSIFLGFLLLLLSPFLSSKFQEVSLMRNLDISQEIVKNYSDTRKGAFNKKFKSDKSKRVYYHFGVRGLTEVIEIENKFTTLYINKYHTFSIKSFDSHDLNRGIIYNELFTNENRKAIIGIGGARSLTYVENEKVRNLDAIEINKDTIIYMKQMTEPLHDKINIINYLNLDGRFYVDTLPDKSLDILIYEGATLQAQAVQSSYLKPNFLSNTDSISNAIKKIKPDGYLVFERTQMYFGLKFFQFKAVLDSLLNLGFNTRVIGDLKKDHYYILANRDAAKLNVVDNILGKSDSLIEINYKRMSYVAGKKFNNCANSYNDNYPFLGIMCNAGKEDTALWPIVTALVVFILTLISLVVYNRKKENTIYSVYSFVFIQGMLQSLSFSFLQFKFDSFLWDDNFTLIFLIISSLVATYLGNRYFEHRKIRKYKLYFLIFSYLISLLILPNYNSYNLESVLLRVVLFSVLVFIFNFLIGGVFSSILSLEKKQNIGKLLLWDSFGLFLGYLSNYFILRVFGLKLFSVFIILLFIVFIYFLIKYKSKFIFYNENNQ